MTGVVFYTDGGCRLNGQVNSQGGYGVYGYTYEDHSKPTKHPKNGLYYTVNGIQKEKDETPIKVLDIFEYSEFLEGPATNNLAELAAAIKALELARSLEVDSILILTDSSYVVNSINNNLLANWIKNDWKKIDQTPIANLESWKQIDSYIQFFKTKSIGLNFQWVKGHSDHYGNNMADMFATMAINAGYSHRASALESTIVYSTRETFNEYKNSYQDKDIMLFFKDLFYNPSVENTHYCFLSNFDKNNLAVGKKSTTSIFGVNVGASPDYIAKIKSFIKERLSPFQLYCIKLSKFENKDLFRLMSKLPFEYMVEKSKSGYMFSGDTTDFIFPFTYKFPFILDVAKTFDTMVDVSLNHELDQEFLFDITEHLYDETKKLKLGNQDKYLDVLPFIQNTKLSELFVHKLLLQIGTDIPNYFALKNLEDLIQKVDMLVRLNPETLFATIYVQFHLSDRRLITCNFVNKFLFKPQQ